jgi:serine protease Do
VADRPRAGAAAGAIAGNREADLWAEARGRWVQGTCLPFEAFPIGIFPILGGLPARSSSKRRRPMADRTGADPEHSGRPRPLRPSSARRMTMLACLVALLATGAWALDWKIGTRGSPTAAGPGRAAEPKLASGLVSGPPGFADLVDAVRPAVAGVQAMTLADSEEPDGLSTGGPFVPELKQPDQAAPRAQKSVVSQGSAFFISADGYAVTNSHVIDGSSTAELQTEDKQTYTAKVVGSDPVSDIALLKVDGRSDFVHVSLAEHAPRVGDWVLAVGNPFGLGGTVTAGIVSARDRDIGTNSYDGLIQIDAPINKGDSGGPSFDLQGKVIGINTIILSPSGGSIGIAFAIPADTVKTIVAQLKDKGAVTRGWLGLQTQALTPELAESLDLHQAEGALVSQTEANSPSAKAGLAAGDLIVSVDGKPVKTARELAKTVSDTAPGASLTLALLRGGEQKSIAVTLGEMPAARKAAAEAKQKPSGDTDLGLTLAPASLLPSGGDGVIVTSVDPNGRAAERGLAPGDIILEAGGKPVQTAADVQSAVAAARAAGKRMVLMRLKSGQTARFVTLAIEPAG